MKSLLTLTSWLLLLLVPVAMAANAMDFESAVSLPSLNSTTSFWLDLPPEDSPLADVGSTGSLTQDADICVIGSGITGVGVVWHLVKDLQGSLEEGTKMQIVLLEARQFCKDLRLS
jgi:NADH dehydrogenase FAD-containing subunit